VPVIISLSAYGRLRGTSVGGAVEFEALIARLRAGDEDERRAAALELARDASGADALIGLVRDKSRDQGRAEAIEGLVTAAGSFPGQREEITRLLIQVFRENSSESWEAASALVEVDSPRAIAEMLKAAAAIAGAQPGQDTGDSDWLVGHGLQLLARRDEKWQEQAIEPLTMLLRRNPDSWSVPDALSDIDDDRAFFALFHALEDHPSLMGYLVSSPRVAAHAEEVAAAIGRFIEVPEESFSAACALTRAGRPGIRLLLRYLEHPDPEIRRKVRVAVAADADALWSMLGEIASGTDLDKARASRALASLGEAEAVPYLRGLLGHASPVVRLAASDAFQGFPSQAPVSALRALLVDEIPEIRASAASSLASKARSAARSLAALLSDPDPQVRAAAASALAGVPSVAVSKALLARLNDPDERVSAIAASRMAAAGPDAVPALHDLLVHPHAAVRKIAAVALAGLGRSGQAAIAAAARSDFPLVRGAAGAGAAAYPDGRRVLAALIEDDEIDVRVQALEAIAAADASLLERVTEILRDGGERERKAAAGALLRMVDTGERPGLFFFRAEQAATDASREAARVFLEALSGPSRVVVRAILTAIPAELGTVDPSRDPFPRWFPVSGDGYGLSMSGLADSVIAALEAAAALDPLTARLAARAIEMVRGKLQEKLDHGPNEQGVAYFSAPSTESERQLLRHLSEVENSVPGEPRYLDATFFLNGSRVPGGRALLEGQTYDLEVAIRVSPGGVPAPEGREPIAEPGQDREIEITVVAKGQEGLTVPDQVASLVLPPSGDSTRSAMFRVKAQKATGTQPCLAELRLFLYYRFSLLEQAVIKAEIVSELRPHVRSELGLDAPVTLVHERVERGYDGLQDEIERSLHINVGMAGSAYLLRFTWRGESGDTISLEASTVFSQAALALIVADARRKLLEVTMSATYAKELSPESEEYVEALRSLAFAGRELHTALFRLQTKSAIAEIGRLLDENPPSPGSVVQISVEKEAKSFIFPWALMYDAPIPDDPGAALDPDGFWGLRYCIEQRIPGFQWIPSAGEPVRASPLHMAFMLWEQFANASDHRMAIDDLARRYPGIEVSRPPINQASAAKVAMTSGSPSDIFYFFTHAHMRKLAPGVADAFLEILQGLPDDHPAYKAFKAAQERANKYAHDPSWIELTYGRLDLSDLQATKFDLRNDPLIFLNACESSQLTPSFEGQSFPEFFIDRGASAFLGTECTMTTTFARPFGELVLRKLLEGQNVGAAVLAARRHFIAERNPLGLAYNQYGNTGFRLKPAPARVPDPNEIC
jgi:HEAT repeat protein